MYASSFSNEGNSGLITCFDDPDAAISNLKTNVINITDRVKLFACADK